jgi:hypothetical protein
MMCACRKAICYRMGASEGVGSSPVVLSEFPVLIGSGALINSDAGKAPPSIPLLPYPLPPAQQKHW